MRPYRLYHGPNEGRRVPFIRTPMRLCFDLAIDVGNSCHAFNQNSAIKEGSLYDVVFFPLHIRYKYVF